eukprot:UN30031
MHNIQAEILDRAVQLVKPGGLIVYSTCSMNMWENECVISKCLNKYGLDNLKLVEPDIKQKCKGHKFHVRDGLSSWKGIDFDTMCPVNSEELGLEKCMRIIPHDNESCGFFTGVIQKSIHFVNEPESSTDNKIVSFENIPQDKKLIWNHELPNYFKKLESENQTDISKNKRSTTYRLFNNRSDNYEQETHDDEYPNLKSVPNSNHWHLENVLREQFKIDESFNFQRLIHRGFGEYDPIYLVTNEISKILKSKKLAVEQIGYR